MSKNASMPVCQKPLHLVSSQLSPWMLALRLLKHSPVRVVVEVQLRCLYVPRVGAMPSGPDVNVSVYGDPLILQVRAW